MPASTGVAAVPASRPSFELQAGFIPGYYLSSAVQEKPKGASIGQASLLFEPDRWFALPGLILGVRAVGGEGTGAYGEPMLGYRAHLDSQQRLSLGIVGYVTHAGGSHNGASYSAARGGGEGVLDFRVTGQSQIFELHLFTSGSLTGLAADGEYCLDADDRYGVDCEDPPVNLVSASAGGAYPSVAGGIALDFARGLPKALHGGRLAAQVAGGTMPAVLGAEQVSARGYSALGLSLTLGLGAKE